MVAVAVTHRPQRLPIPSPPPVARSASWLFPLGRRLESWPRIGWAVLPGWPLIGLHGCPSTPPTVTSPRVPCSSLPPSHSAPPAGCLWQRASNRLAAGARQSSPSAPPFPSLNPHWPALPSAPSRARSDWPGPARLGWAQNKAARGPRSRRGWAEGRLRPARGPEARRAPSCARRRLPRPPLLSPTPPAFPGEPSAVYSSTCCRWASSSVALGSSCCGSSVGSAA